MKNYLFETVLLLVIMGAMVVVPVRAKMNNAPAGASHEACSVFLPNTCLYCSRYTELSYQAPVVVLPRFTKKSFSQNKSNW